MLSLRQGHLCLCSPITTITAGSTMSNNNANHYNSYYILINILACRPAPAAAATATATATPSKTLQRYQVLIFYHFRFKIKFLS